MADQEFDPIPEPPKKSTRAKRDPALAAQLRKVEPPKAEPKITNTPEPPREKATEDIVRELFWTGALSNEEIAERTNWTVAEVDEFFLREYPKDIEMPRVQEAPPEIQTYPGMSTTEAIERHATERYDPAQAHRDKVEDARVYADDVPYAAGLVDKGFTNEPQGIVAGYGVPIPPGSSVTACMVGDCGWQLVHPRPKDSASRAMRLAAAMGVDGAAQALSLEIAEQIDIVLTSHLQEHDVVEWAETVRDLEDANQAWEEAMTELQGQLARYEEMNVVLTKRLQEAEEARTVYAAGARQAFPQGRGEQGLPMGIPAPYKDPMREPIVPSDKRPEGVVARKG